MSATTIIDTAPLGAVIRYTDCSPKPPARFGKEVSRHLLARLLYKDLIAIGPRSPRLGAPHTFVTMELFLTKFDLNTLRHLPELHLPPF